MSIFFHLLELGESYSNELRTPDVLNREKTLPCLIGSADGSFNLNMPRLNSSFVLNIENLISVST